MVCQILLKKQPIIFKTTHIWEHETLQPTWGSTCVFFVGFTSQKIMHWDCCLCNVPFGSLVNLVHHFLWTTCPPTSIPQMFKFSMSHVWILTGSHVFVYMQTSTKSRSGRQIFVVHRKISDVTCPLAEIGLDFSQQTLFHFFFEH